MNTIYLNEEAVSQRGDVQLEHLDIRNASERRTSMVEMCPGVFLLATVHLEKNMCMVELLRNKDKENTVVPSRRLSTGESLERSPKVDNELVNELAKLFRIPKTIQVLPDDEGAISTIHLVLDQNTSSSAGGTSEAGKGPIDRLHLHLFIGTTSGTVLVCNALSGTVLAITQFLRNRNFFREKSATEQFTEEENTPDSGALFQRREMEKIEGVVKFVVHKKNKHLTFNPSMAVNLPKVAQGPNSTYGVYIVYEAGSVVLLPREALDVFVKVSAEKKDGRRPHFLIDWTVGQDSYPVAGQALEFTKYVRYVYKLRKATRFSQNETITAKNTTARYDEPLNAGRKKPFIRDADFFLFSDNDALDIVSETGSDGHGGARGVRS
ncbi:hypothetical protein AGDE_13684 [Angomonas deanei]|uniref:Uncharacterized protein n=1 Tax=Angomonas deanei TaxID=59799 RepID=A0A7G2C0X8_9TRYP|nr:hypothetical protein AGDE_13684 [Angomonas deanei]CAD2213185.1 hypothetical protein, conserved [Angomonas deanei]|eukprot:EPY21924.1 hypothetical protein AGDE_13684 [Angomonas deanei]